MRLDGLRVLVTRPAEQAPALLARLTEEGAHPLHFAAIEILDPHNRQALLDAIGRLADFHWVIFVSPNAVHRAMALWRAREETWPAHVRIACIGRGSARELQRFGIQDALAPTGRFDSESLLLLPPLQAVDGQKILIFRGEGGRELLGDTLETRGAQVTYADCYRRAAPTADVAALLRTWARTGVDIVVVTSVEALRNLYEALGQVGQRWLARTPLLLSSERIRAAAADLGLEGATVLAANATDDALLEALRTWRAQTAPDN
ncbi:MAG: uroporphyrinogen-III synthase [Gammaproteobacteria bacterium]|nr:uroporphyrinogen-III synthase [Gammaproteobacteria bacterium]